MRCFTKFEEELILNVRLGTMANFKAEFHEQYVAKFDDPMTEGCQGTKDFLA